MQKLTNSQLHYMRCIRALAREGSVRATDISRSIGLSMPSVHNMLCTLEGLELVEKHRHSVYLTEAGEHTLRYYDSAVTAAAKLLETVGIPDSTEEAMALVTALNEQSIETIIHAMQ